MDFMLLLIIMLRVTSAPAPAAVDAADLRNIFGKPVFQNHAPPIERGNCPLGDSY